MESAELIKSMNFSVVCQIKGDSIIDEVETK